MDTTVAPQSKSTFSMNLFLTEFEKKVSATNARLLLQGAAIKTGMGLDLQKELKKEQAEALCMELIRSGGPGFQVGRTIYNQMHS